MPQVYNDGSELNLTSNDIEQLGYNTPATYASLQDQVNELDGQLNKKIAFPNYSDIHDVITTATSAEINFTATEDCYVIVTSNSATHSGMLMNGNYFGAVAGVSQNGQISARFYMSKNDVLKITAGGSIRNMQWFSLK